MISKGGTKALAITDKAVTVLDLGPVKAILAEHKLTKPELKQQLQVFLQFRVFWGGGGGFVHKSHN